MKMLTVCDGGSSKADWIMRLEDGRMQRIQTTGFNPSYTGGKAITTMLRQALSGKLDTSLEGQVHYYGAGCGDPGRANTVAGALSEVFPRAQILVNSDILAAAKATAGNQPGIVCVLGTGSNSMLYDGKGEADHVTNLGYILGDEGSGSHIGKEFIRACFYRELPPELQPLMAEAFPNGRSGLLDLVYGSAQAASYLASFAKLLSDRQHHAFVQTLVKGCFREFLQKHVCKYEGHSRLPVHFVGSVAWNFRELLQKVLHEMELHAGAIVQRPVEKLLEFHLHVQS